MLEHFIGERSFIWINTYYILHNNNLFNNSMRKLDLISTGITALIYDESRRP